MEAITKKCGLRFLKSTCQTTRLKAIRKRLRKSAKSNPTRLTILEELQIQEALGTVCDRGSAFNFVNIMFPDNYSPAWVEMIQYIIVKYPYEHRI